MSAEKAPTSAYPTSSTRIKITLGYWFTTPSFLIFLFETDDPKHIIVNVANAETLIIFTDLSIQLTKLIHKKELA